MSRIVPLLLALTALAGCMSPELRTARQATENLCVERYADPALRPLAGLVPFRELGKEAPTFEMLRIARLPNPDERAALARWGDGREQCLRMVAATFLTGQRRAESLRYLGETQAALVELTAGRLAYGEAVASPMASSTSASPTHATA